MCVAFTFTETTHQIVGPISSGEFLSADFKALGQYEFRKRTSHVVQALADAVPELNSHNRFIEFNGI